MATTDDLRDTPGGKWGGGLPLQPPAALLGSEAWRAAGWAASLNSTTTAPLAQACRGVTTGGCFGWSVMSLHFSLWRHPTRIISTWAQSLRGPPPTLPTHEVTA